MPLSPDFDRRFLLGVESMDQTHREFAELVDRLEAAEAAEFPELFRELARHTAAHFQAEERLMCECGFPAIAEHKGEHERILGLTMQMLSALGRGRSALARAFVTEQLPSWFEQHAATMDSALAARIKIQALGPAAAPVSLGPIADESTPD